MGFVSFMSASFLAAGAVCAVAPVLIHLLNRRRHRIVKWGAMDFLRQALQQNRKILDLRDFLLLAVRTLAVLLFGAALARPFFARQDQAIGSRQPLHLVLVIDNSLSMSYETLEGSLLELAKRRARSLLDELPSGSRVSVVPACGSRESNNSDALDSLDEAREALGRLEVVDRSAEMTRVLELARLACESAPELAKRLVFISDQQKLNWQRALPTDWQVDLPPLQCVVVRPPDWENTWIADVRIPDGLADSASPATIVVDVAHQGALARRDLQVTLLSGETVLGQQTVTVEPGGATREVSFECVLGGLGLTPEPGQAVFVPLTAKIGADRLSADDQRCLSVPVVAALPIVFIDQFSDAEEDVVRGRLGETRHLRKLLVPQSARGEALRQPIKIRHVSPAEVDKDTLADARLVVVAGLAEPEGLVPLLADYVQHGGHLLIAAGGDFDPVAWTRQAWLNGQGLLPLPLQAEPLGVTPEESPERLAPFQLAFASLVDEPMFQLPGVSRSDLQALYAEPYFFKTVQIDESPEAFAAIEATEAQRIENEQNRELEWDNNTWLLWTADDSSAIANQSLASPSLSERNTASTRDQEPTPDSRKPRILARYETGKEPPFLVSRHMGQGEVVFCSTGLLSPWNTLPKTNAVLMFDRLMRSMVESTLPQRNLSPSERLTLPLPRSEQHLVVSLARPGAVVEEPLDVTYVSADRRGVVLHGLLTRGVYRVSGKRPGGPSNVANDPPVWAAPLAVNGSAEESNLAPLTHDEFNKLTEAGGSHWVGAGEAIDLSGAIIRGQNTWWWLVLCVVGLLVLEFLILSGSVFHAVPAAWFARRSPASPPR